MPISPRDYEGISQRLTEAGVRITDNVAVALQGLHSSVIQDPDNISRAANIYTRRIAAATRQWERDWREWADKDILHAYKIGVSHTDAEIRALRERGINVRTPERPVTNRQAMTANLPPLTLDRNVPSWMKKEFKLLPNHLTAFNVFRRAAYHYLEGTGLQIIRASKDIYRKTAVEVMSKSFRESDVFTRRKFSQSMLNEFADKGLKSVTYRNGKKVSIEAYSEMLGRTLPAHASVQASLNRYSEHGYDLVRVTSHFRACELCVPYEGAILSSSGMSSGYESLDSAVANGLFHPNCLHAVNPYIPGLSQKQEIRVDPAERELIDKHGYKDAQKIAYHAQERQRQIERNIRGWKKREIVALDDIEKKKAHTKVLEWNKAQRMHLEANPFLPRKYEREGVSGWYDKVRSSRAASPPSTFSGVKMTDELKGVVKRYTTGGYKSINAQADLYLSGTPKEKAFSKTGEMLFDTVNKSQQSFESLYRIENVEGFVLDGNRIISSPLHQGQELTWGLRSTSKSEKFVSRAALGRDKNLPFVGGSKLENRVIYRIKNGTGLDVTTVSPYDQSEVIISGKYTVLNPGVVTEIGGQKVIVVDLVKVR